MPFLFSLNKRCIRFFFILPLMMGAIFLASLPVSVFASSAFSASSPSSPSSPSSHPKPSATLNIQQGPLGVTLILRGKNFHPGAATITYVDAQNVSNTFDNLHASTIQVRYDGVITSTALVLPNSGPIGTWKITVTDSAKASVTVPYHVLVASAPSISLNPAVGKAGDVIAVSGSNWLPQGTSVQFAYLDANNDLVSLSTTVQSDKNGMITGAVRIPSQFDGTQVSMTLVATDTQNAMRAQAELNILSLTPTPVPTATLLPTPTRTPVVASTQSKDPDNFSLSMSSSSLELVLLIVGGALGIAAILLILFLLPWKKSSHDQLTVPNKVYRRR